MNHPVFSGEDFDDADYISEIRPRPATDDYRWSDDELSLIRRFPKVGGLLHTLARPLAKLAPCDHDWPDCEEGRGTDINGSCTKCGMSFMLYVHSDCP